MTSPNSDLYTIRSATMPGFALTSGQLLRCMKRPAILGEMVGATVQGTPILGRLSPCFDRAVNETACRSHIIGAQEDGVSTSALEEKGVLDGPFATAQQEMMSVFDRRESRGARALAWTERKWIWRLPANRPPKHPALAV